MAYQILTWKQACNRVSDIQDFFSLSCTPNEERCTPAGHSMQLQILECTAYINQLKRENGSMPLGAEFFIIEHDHEFGIYHEAGIFFVPTRPEEEEYSESEVYANKCQIGPDHWDKTALNELQRGKHPLYQPAKVIQIKAA